jgi:heme A synthase
MGKPTVPSSRRVLLLGKLQGAYDAAGALWPLLAMDRFEDVTGPKHDEWLVRTVAGILLFLGALLLHDAFVRRQIDRGLRRMALGVSGVLALVALVSSIGGWISWLYFFDGLIHLTFTMGWVWIVVRRSTATSNPGHT